MIDGYLVWGDPDMIEWRDEEGYYHEMGYTDEGAYAFMVVDGVFISACDKDRTSGMSHHEFLDEYVRIYGWKKQYVASPTKGYPETIDWLDQPLLYIDDFVNDTKPVYKAKYRFRNEENTLFDIRVEYIDGTFDNWNEITCDFLKNYDLSCRIEENEYDAVDENDWYVIDNAKDFRERGTYGEFLGELLGTRQFEGRIYEDYENRCYFITFWDDNNADEVFDEIVDFWGGQFPYYCIMVSESHAEEAEAKYGETGMPSYYEWVYDCSFDTPSEVEAKQAEKQQKLAIHLANQQEKNKFFSNFRQNRGELQGQKLGNMTMAQYHNLIRQENRERVKKIIKETIERMVKEMRPY